MPFSNTLQYGGMDRRNALIQALGVPTNKASAFINLKPGDVLKDGPWAGLMYLGRSSAIDKKNQGVAVLCFVRLAAQRQWNEAARAYLHIPPVLNPKELPIDNKKGTIPDML